MYSDKRMLDLLEILKAENYIRFEKDFCEACGLLPQNLSRIRKGDAHFTPDHIKNICTIFLVNSNWVLGLEHEVFRNQNNVNQKVNPNKLNRPSDRVLN
tara:strand:+ start:38443 stop:38739 length:297 start_codon:yes stop_codon:yes gene_type:complete